MRQPWQHDADHGEVYPGLFAAGEQLIVLGEATPSGEPSEGSFSYPTPLEHMKPLKPDLLPVYLDPFPDPDATQAAPGMRDNCYLPAESLLHPSYKIPFLVSAVHPDELETGKALSEWQEQVFAPVMVLNTGLMDELVEDQPIRVDQQVPLAAFDLFAPVVAAPPPF